MRLQYCMLPLCLALSACTDQGSLVVVSIESNPAITGIAKLHVSTTVGTANRVSDVQLTPAESTPITVSIDLPPGLTGTIMVHVDCSDANGSPLGSGDGSTMIQPGTRADLSINIGKQVTDGGMDASPDLATDAGGDAAGGDLATDGGNGDAGDGGVVTACDPKGVTGPACVWRWQSPLPQGEAIVGLFAYSDSDIFAYTAASTVLHRDATVWTLLPAQPLPASGQLQPVAFAASSTSNDQFAVGYNLMTGAGNPIQVFHSTNKGGSWTQETIPTLTPWPYATGIAANGTGAIVVTDNGTIFTRDATSGTWSNQQLSGKVFEGVFMGATLNLAVGSDSTGGMIAHATAGTSTWTAVDNITGAGSGTVFYGVCGAPTGGGSRYFAVGKSSTGAGVIFTSTDGTAWTQQTSNATQTLSGCATTDGTNVWAWGQKGIVVHTSNGGSGWATQSSGADPNGSLLAGTVSPQGSVTVGGTHGQLFRTVNGGANWTGETTGPPGGWFGLAAVAPKTIYAVGLSSSATAAIARTTDGTTWNALTVSAGPVLAVWGSSATDVYAVGPNGTVLHSTDGTTFTAYTNVAGGIPASANLTDVAGLSSTNVFIAASTGLYQSTDHGASWHPVTVTGLTGMSVTSVFAMGSDLWIGASNGQVFHTTDGTNWNAQPITGSIGSTANVHRIRGYAPSVLFAIFDNAGAIARSTNGGGTWTVQSPPSGKPLGQGTLFLSVSPTGNYVYAGGDATGGSLPLVVSQDQGMNWVPVNNTVTAPSSYGVVPLAIADNDVYATWAAPTGADGILHYGN